jgi:hypothetical protein
MEHPGARGPSAVFWEANDTSIEKCDVKKTKAAELNPQPLRIYIVLGRSLALAADQGECTDGQEAHGCGLWCNLNLEAGRSIVLTVLDVG